MAFVYRPRNPDTILKRAAQQGGNFQGFIREDFKVYKVRDGANYIRILPPTWEGAEHYGYEVWVHNSIGPDRAALICLYKQDDAHQRCPICEAVAALDRAGDDETAKEIAAKKRVMVWLLDMAPGGDMSPQIWAMPWTVDRDIAAVSQDRQTGEIYVVDHDEYGYNIQFDKTGQQRQTKYAGIRLDRQPTSVDPEIMEYVNQVPLPTTLIWRTYEEMQDIYGGGMMDEPQPAPARPMMRPGSNGQAAPVARAGAPRLAAPQPARRPALPTRAAPPADDPPYDPNDPNDPNYVEGWEEPQEQEQYQPPPRVNTARPGQAPRPPGRPQLPPTRATAPARAAPPAASQDPAERAAYLQSRYGRR